MGSGLFCCPRCLGRGSAWEEKACSALLSQAAARSHLRPGLLGPHHCTGLCLTLNSLSPFPKKPHSVSKGSLTDHARPPFNPAPCRHGGGRCPTADSSHIRSRWQQGLLCLRAPVHPAAPNRPSCPCPHLTACGDHYHHPSCKGGVNACYPHPLLDHEIRDTGIPKTAHPGRVAHHLSGTFRLVWGLGMGRLQLPTTPARWPAHPSRA